MDGKNLHTGAQTAQLSAQAARPSGRGKPRQAASSQAAGERDGRAGRQSAAAGVECGSAGASASRTDRTTRQEWLGGGLERRAATGARGTTRAGNARQSGLTTLACTPLSI